MLITKPIVSDMTQYSLIVIGMFLPLVARTENFVSGYVRAIVDTSRRRARSARP
jgi:hypothetical protein